MLVDGGERHIERCASRIRGETTAQFARLSPADGSPSARKTVSILCAVALADCMGNT